MFELGLQAGDSGADHAAKDAVAATKPRLDPDPQIGEATPVPLNTPGLEACLVHADWPAVHLIVRGTGEKLGVE